MRFMEFLLVGSGVTQVDVASVSKTTWMKVGVVLIDVAFVCLAIVYGLVLFGVR